MGASTEYPTLQSLNDFLVSRTRAQERVEQASASKPRSSGKTASYAATAGPNSSPGTQPPATQSSAALAKPPKKIIGIGVADAGRTKGQVTFKLSSRHSNDSVIVSAHILGDLTTQLPSVALNILNWDQYKQLQLADPAFMRPGPIDIIIGADHYGLIIKDTLIKRFEGLPIAHHHLRVDITRSSQHTHRPSITYHTAVEQSTQQLQDLLSRFWTQEEIPGSKIKELNPEEEACEAHFQQIHQQDSSGRYKVRLPVKSSPQQLGNSYSAAYRCLIHLKRRLDHDDRLKALYLDFLKEYKELNHMVESIQSTTSEPAYYLPHYGVLRESSITTKLRVVFNGSKPTSSGLSLNDVLHTGPKLQLDIFDVLIGVRTHKHIFITDITKMFRQILVDERDQNLQQILWFNEQGQITPYKLTTVTYGTRPAPYMAIRALLQLVEDDGHRFPLAIIPLTHGRYVDDIFGGADDLNSLQQVADQLEALCKAGGFPLAKWASNHPELQQLNHVEAINNHKFEDPDSSTKILGMYWSSHSDQFYFTYSPPCSTQKCTKWIILSEIAQIFDPLGFLAPLIIRAKVFMQEL
ncbi:uncharacterized protein LOC128668533 [Microplitis demolitor]|uniref:uncharacterized protein LOC128668533 n=1 Tax=Microplitis demolitor TaxID=69319 RepID=UPI00235B6F1A|nr:uncharacterized protein LOC128668533 [Microplitis demolitor]